MNSEAGPARCRKRFFTAMGAEMGTQPSTFICSAAISASTPPIERPHTVNTRNSPIISRHACLTA